MYTIHDGEIVLKERYGSTQREILYVRPIDQSNVVVLDENKTSDVSTWFTKIFLPQGYPASVSKDYLAYQIWDTAQAFCSTITGTLATHQVLQGLGVGSSTASPLAATTTWVVRDGCGHLGRILFAFSHGTQLDAYSKKWRLYADTLNDAAMCLEIALPLFENYTVLVLCASNVMKAIVGVAGGATRAAMTQHHAIRGNLADVNAKDSAQETAVNLVASVIAILIMTVFGNSVVIFVFLMVLHIIFNYMAVRSVCLRTLNETRYLQVIDFYLKKEAICAPCEINATEPIVLYFEQNLLDLKMCGLHIKLGCTLKDIVRRQSKCIHLESLKSVYFDRPYLLLPYVQSRKMYVLLRDTATTEDILCAYFHAVVYSMIISAINDENWTLTGNSSDMRPFAQVCHAVQEADWSREPVADCPTPNGFSYGPSLELSKYVNRVVTKEWTRVRDAMTSVGWDLTRHLIITEEWRVTDKMLFPTDEQSTTDFDRNLVGLIEPDAFSEPFNVEEEGWTSENVMGKIAYTIEPENKTKESSVSETQPEKSSVATSTTQNVV